MKKRFLLLAAAILMLVTIQAQSFTRSVNTAYVIVRMVEKFHFQPRPLNDQFSANIYTQFLKALDDDRIFFLAGDINTLQEYKYRLDDEIKNKRQQFLQTVFSLYKKRLTEARDHINTICRSSFDFNIKEKFTITDDTSYTNNQLSWRTKIYKIVKLAVLNDILKSNNNLASLSAAALKKYLQNAEPLSRAKIQNAFNRSFNRMLYSAGRLEKILGDQYCKTIALCYDPHTEYLPAPEKETGITPGESEIIFGFTLKTDERGNVFIYRLIPGSPAYKSGQINSGDNILSVQREGQLPVDLSNATIKEITDILNAEGYNKIILTIKKADGSKKHVTLLKEKVENNTEESKVKSFLLKGEKTIGYISLPAFYEDWENESGIMGCANDVAKEIVKLKKENIQGLIIDIRNNEGGSMQEAIEMAGIFIDAGPVAQYKTRLGITTLKDINKGTIYDGPLLLMVNGYSASASEMLAGILQDYNRAVIAGSATYGKATTQLILPLDTSITRGSKLAGTPFEDFIKISTGKIYRLTGKTIQATGVIPDIAVPDIYPKREKDNPFFFPASTILANKYYQPAAKFDFKNVIEHTNREITSSVYFKRLKEYVVQEYTTEKKDVSLHISDALALQKKSAPKANDGFQNKIFVAENHRYDNELLRLNNTRKEVNREWREHLSGDEYVKVAYQVMLQMFK